jgi:nucleoside 2-deoxyribosyltransferase
VSIFVYIAGSSTELDRMQKLAAAIDTHNQLNPLSRIEITGKWWDVIQARGEANPINAPFHERAAYASDDIAAVKEADFLLLLMPPVGVNSVGCYWEAGYADALDKEVLIAGDSLERSIFTTRGACFNSDEAALEYLMDIVFATFDVDAVRSASDAKAN